MEEYVCELNWWYCSNKPKCTLITKHDRPALITIITWHFKDYSPYASICTQRQIWCPLRTEILSTTLFNVKINDIVKQVYPGVECSLYVDDFVIMYRSPTIYAIHRKLQHTIHRLEKWTLENGFTIFKNKTIAMHFCPNKKMHGSCFEIRQWSYPVCQRS